MAFCVQGAYTIQNCLAVGTENLYGDIILCGTNRSYGEGIVANPSPSGYMALFFRAEAYQGSSYTCTWAIGKNAASETGGELLQIVRQGLTGGALYRADAPQQWKTNGDSIFGFNVGIGTTSPNRKLTISRATESTSPQIELRNVGGITDGNFDGISFTQGATGDVPLGSIRLKNATNGYPGFGIYTRSGDAAESEKVTITNGGNVGINTTSPQSKLHVEGGQIRMHGLPSDDVTACSGYYIGNAPNNEAFQWQMSCNFNLSLWTYSATNGLNWGLRGPVITQTGRVGIGTTSPGYKLNVVETQAGCTTIGIQNTSTTGYSGAHIFNSSGTLVGHFGYANSSIVGGLCDLVYFGSIASKAVVFTTNDTEKVRITTGGNVGIGTTSPNAILHVQGSSADGTATFRVTSTSAPSSFNYAGSLINGCLCSNRNYILLIGQDLSNRNSGYIGYNHTGTANSNNNFLTFGHFQSDNLLNLLGNGNLGVGTTTPSYRLHVNGTFYAAGSSIKYKEGICNYDTDSCLFMCLKPVAYQYKDEFKHLGKELKSDIQIGLIAEDVAEVMPELAILVNEEDNKVVRNVDYEKLSIVLLAEVQKLRKEVDELKK